MTMVLPYELSTIFNEMHEARRAKLYYPCLLVALTLPDICSALVLPRNKFVTRQQYVEFIDKYSSPSEIGDTGEGIYKMRGGLVHRGDKSGHVHSEATHVIFSLPESDSYVHGVSIEIGDKRAAMFDLDRFVDAMDSSVRRWYMTNKSHPMILENLPFLIRCSATGVPPFVKGLPAIVSGN